MVAVILLVLIVLLFGAGFSVNLLWLLMAVLVVLLIAGYWVRPGWW